MSHFSKSHQDQKQKNKKADADRIRATVMILNKASFKAGRSFDRLLDAVEYLND